VVKIEEYFQIGDYTIKDGLINTDDSVGLIKEVRKLPVQFGHIDGNFSCSNNQLISLEGAPKSVSGNFSCYDNKLTSLAGCPTEVSGYFDCHNNNQLISLAGAPKSVGGSFYLTWSKDLPLLRLVRYQNVQTFNGRVNEIIRKYCNHKPVKEAILLCQKDLIDNGFIGNASW
jgi:hypothetical protein